MQLSHPNVVYLFIYSYCREAYITVQTILWQTYNTHVMIGTILSILTTGERTESGMFSLAEHHIDTWRGFSFRGGGGKKPKN